MNLKQRLTKIVTMEDAETQMRLAKQYFMRLRSESKSNLLTLEQKVVLAQQAKDAENTLHSMRRLVFDIEDAIEAKLSVVDTVLY